MNADKARKQLLEVLSGKLNLTSSSVEERCDEAIKKVKKLLDQRECVMGSLGVPLECYDDEQFVWDQAILGNTALRFIMKLNPQEWNDIAMIIHENQKDMWRKAESSEEESFVYTLQEARKTVLSMVQFRCSVDDLKQARRKDKPNA